MARPRFRGWAVAVIGDLNRHFAEWPGNAGKATAVDHAILRRLQDPGGAALRVHPCDRPTHLSGYTLDYAASGAACQVAVKSNAVQGLLSDHHRLRVFFPEAAGRLRAADTHITGGARWEKGEFWEDALRPVEPTLRFLAGTAAAAARTAVLRNWLIAGAKRRFRQLILDWLVYWRSVTLVLAGHFGSLVRVSPPPRGPTWTSPQELFQKLAGPSPGEEEQERTSEKVDTYLKLAEQDPERAEGYLSRILNPPRHFSFALTDPNTGGTPGMEETIDALEEDLLSRHQNVRRAPVEIQRQVERRAREARALARAEAILEPADAFRQSKVDAVIEERVHVGKASYRLPRQALRDGGWAHRKLLWALVCLVWAVGLVASSSSRLVTPVSKTGAATA